LKSLRTISFSTGKKEKRKRMTLSLLSYRRKEKKKEENQHRKGYRNEQAGHLI